VLDVELGLGDSVLIELTGYNRVPLSVAGDVLRPVQCESARHRSNPAAIHKDSSRVQNESVACLSGADCRQDFWHTGCFSVASLWPTG